MKKAVELQIYLKETLAREFSCEFYEFYFTQNLRAAASIYLKPM